MTTPEPTRRRSLTSRWQFWAGIGVIVVAAIVVAWAIGASNSVRSDLSARDQELCNIALDENEPIGFLSTQVDELIKNDGKFSSEGDAFAFRQVPLGRSENELDSRIANHDQPDSAGFIDDPQLLERAKALRDVIFDATLAADQGNSIDRGTLTKLRSAIDDLVHTCTG